MYSCVYKNLLYSLSVPSSVKFFFTFSWNTFLWPIERSGPFVFINDIDITSNHMSSFIIVERMLCWRIYYYAFASDKMSWYNSRCIFVGYTKSRFKLKILPHNIHVREESIKDICITFSFGPKYFFNPKVHVYHDMIF